jgi:multiple sugar transport system permease protein
MPIAARTDARHSAREAAMKRALGAAAALAFFAGPFGWMVLTSLWPEAELTRALPASLTTASYQGLGAEFLRAVLNSLLVAAGTTFVCLGIGASAAFAIARLDLRGASVLLNGALAISMFPPIATVSPLYLLLRAIGLRDSLAGLVIPYTTFALPMSLWLLTSFFRELPDELYRAARVDGCTPWQAFTKVFLPLSAPALATTAILVFISSWNELLFALAFLSTPAKRTIPVAIALFAGEHREPWGQIAAASVVAVAPLAVLTFLFQKRIVAGLTAGAVKG